MRLSDFYQECLQIADGALAGELARFSELRAVPKGEILYKQGVVPAQVCFLLQGVVRGFILDVNGKDITDCIAFRCGEPILPDGEFTQPASVTVEALEDSQVVSIDTATVQRMLEERHELAPVYRRLLVHGTNRQRALKIVSYQYTAAQRYRWFLREYPGLIDRIQHKYIASLLNMTPVTLSKIRRALKEHADTGELDEIAVQARECVEGAVE